MNIDSVVEHPDGSCDIQLSGMTAKQVAYIMQVGLNKILEEMLERERRQPRLFKAGLTDDD